jgi:hypothetical protein
MQSDALNKQILHDQFEKSEPHATDLINCLNKSKHRKTPASRKDLSSTSTVSMTPMVLLLVSGLCTPQ